MPWMGKKGAITVSAVTLLSIASATPDIQFPVDSQVPPVAQASELYNFVFAESTFTSAAGHITYALAEEPAWLQLDSGTRTFSGRPESNDVGTVTFQLLASDEHGPTPLSVTLVVVEDRGLEVGRSIPAQLGGFGIPSSPTSILFYPLQSFAFNLLPDTFLRTSSSTTYYAISEDNSPLPSWLEFNTSNLGFSGTTPPLVSPTATPQTYGVRVIASDVPGFSEASAAFQIVIAYHILSFSVADLNINATSGKEVTSSPLRQALSLDGKSVQDTDIVSVSTDAPHWLVLDQESISVSGIPPADATSFRVTISVMDALGDFANVTVSFSFTSNAIHLFLGNAPVANATIGQKFTYTINRGSLASENVTVVADLGNASAWMAFNPSNLSFNGNVPQDLAPGSIDIALYATLGQEIEEETLEITLMRGSTTTSVPHTVTSSGSVQSFASITPSPSTSPTTANHSHLSRRTRLKITLAAVLSALAFILLLILFVFCQRRKQKHAPDRCPDDLDPVPALPANEQVDPGLPDAGFAETIDHEEAQRNATPNEPPRIELSWAPDSLRKAKARLSRRMSTRDDGILNLSFSGSLPKDSESPLQNSRNDNKGSQHSVRRSLDVSPFVSTRTSNHSPRRMPFRPVQARSEHATGPKRASRVLSAASTVTSGLPNRLSGAGHGSGGLKPPGCNDIRGSWQDTESSLPSTESRATGLDIVEAFPHPPIDAVGSRSLLSPQRTGKVSLRLIASSSSQTDSPLDERQRWYTERARDPIERSRRFSHARISKPHSGARQSAADISIPSHYEQVTPTNSYYQVRSHNAAFRPSNEPEILNVSRSPGRPFIRPPSELMRARSTASSGQFDSALSTSSSQWEDEVFTAEIEFQEIGAQSTRKDGQAHWRRSATVATGLSEASSTRDLEKSPASRKLRLGDVPGQRPVSVGEGNLQKSERSHQGSLAFV